MAILKIGKKILESTVIWVFSLENFRIVEQNFELRRDNVYTEPNNFTIVNYWFYNFRCHHNFCFVFSQPPLVSKTPINVVLSCMAMVTTRKSNQSPPREDEWSKARKCSRTAMQ